MEKCIGNCRSRINSQFRFIVFYMYRFFHSPSHPPLPRKVVSLVSEVRQQSDAVFNGIYSAQKILEPSSRYQLNAVQAFFNSSLVSHSFYKLVKQNGFTSPRCLSLIFPMAGKSRKDGSKYRKWFNKFVN